MFVTFLMVFAIILFFMAALVLRSLIKGRDDESCSAPGPEGECSLCSRKDGGCRAGRAGRNTL